MLGWRVPFCGGVEPTSVLSVLAGAHSVGEGIFAFLTTQDATPLRLLCREMRDAIASFEWWDDKTRIINARRLPSWRAAFPFARAAVLTDAHLGPAEWESLRNLESLSVVGCTGVTDKRLEEFTPDLVNFDGRLCHGVTYEGLSAFPFLEWADMRGCPDVGEGADDDDRLVTGNVSRCDSCRVHLLSGGEPCARTRSDFTDAACLTALEEDGGDAYDKEDAADMFCEECIVANGCHICRSLECRACTAEQYQDLGIAYFDVGLGIGRCEKCNKIVCGRTCGGRVCGGTCSWCGSFTCVHCGELESACCDACETQCYRQADALSLPENWLVCGICRRIGVVCGTGYENDECPIYARRKAAEERAYERGKAARVAFASGWR